ncbi:hypothetical protein D3H64_09215 [Atopobacter sp. AH10]|uniref:YycH family regulatory protein n=1 Tax=Atopobacter sp. AH10 TaxID=2315861 RepID=UPI000EF2291E|nr:two-component system activity regulator YycH [Atopobacter sp. AH10]RLK62594.1 hypothetical protein D3H64_09215 [Atopobacter sp. AH10]
MRKHLTTILLMVLVSLSLFLTYYNVITPSIYQEKQATLTKTEVHNNKQRFDSPNAFLPVELVHYANGQLISYNEAHVIKKMMTELSGKLSDFKEAGEATVDMSQFFESESWQLVYKAPLTMNMTGLIAKRNLNPRINRIVALKNHPNTVYFLNEEKKMVYSASIPHETQQMIKGLIEGVKGQEVDYFEFKGRVVYLPVNPVTMEKESFLAEMVSTDNYVAKFFSDTLGLSVHSSSNISQYTNNQGELKIDSENNRFYYRSNAQLEEGSLDDRLHKAHKILTEFESWPYQLRYTGIDQTDEKVYFRRYYKNRPIFGAPDRSILAIIPGKEQVKYLSMPTINLLFRLKRNVEEEQLVSGSEMVEQMRRVGYDVKKIEDACIGYDWQVSEENSRVVLLVPKWFVRYQSSWRSLEDWLMEGERKYGLQAN